MSPILTHLMPQVSSQCVVIAAFIVGCLAHEELIPLDLGDHSSRENYLLMVRVIARCLAEIEATMPGDKVQLPFKY